MAQRYFSNFPLINYNGSSARNILLKSQFFKSVIDNVGAYYIYTVQDGERPDTVAANYYGHSDYTWVVLFSNQIVDPYFEWPLTSLQLNEFITKKYGDIPSAQSTIVHYTYDSKVNVNDPEYQYNLSYIMDIDTYNYKVANDSGFMASYWIAKSAYDYEVERNDSARSIRLISSRYLNQVNREISTIFKK